MELTKRHNEYYNFMNRKTFRGKSRRKIPKALKAEWVRVFYMQNGLNVKEGK